ncbi:STING domain-containing protein [Tenacibaculum ovolyticum]|uniref:STING domain-containing protein n=1 Tax=Tenacibaculum ovolyticum TaxID=104270 RepID=UPI0007ED15A4|nr:STING domain-containing protein [Tenacibaculum ovolyticum]
MDRKINIFIGSSSEGLKYAKKICGLFNETNKFNCVLWNKDTFTYNETFLNSLIKASLIYDFGIFVASSDDIALIRDNIKEIPRDNVLFEYGLFLGALGNKKTFLLQENNCTLPTDLLGYTTPRFKKTFTKKKWIELTESIGTEITKQFQRSEIQTLPSTSLAIGYFNSFLSKLSKYIFKKDGCVLNKAQINHNSVIIKVLIPKELSDDVGAKAFVYYTEKKLQIDEIGEVKRPFPVRYYKSSENENLSIIDIPTTLNAIRSSINLLVPDTGIGINKDKIRLERKELENFKRTLEFLIIQNDYAKNIVKVEWLE